MYFLLLTFFVTTFCYNYSEYDWFDDYELPNKKTDYLNEKYHWYIQRSNRTKSEYFYCGMDFDTYDIILGIRLFKPFEFYDIYDYDIYDSDINIDNFNHNILPNNTDNMYYDILPNNTVNKYFKNKFQIKIHQTYLKTKKKTYVTCYTNYNFAYKIGSICKESTPVRECFYTSFDDITGYNIEILKRKYWGNCYIPDGISNVLEERAKKCW